jgi:hypothetical protein
MGRRSDLARDLASVVATHGTDLGPARRSMRAAEFAGHLARHLHGEAA